MYRIIILYSINMCQLKVFKAYHRRPSSDQRTDLYVAQELVPGWLVSEVTETHSGRLPQVWTDAGEKSNLNLIVPLCSGSH
jgi:hypothetical protein